MSGRQPEAPQAASAATMRDAIQPRDPEPRPGPRSNEMGDNPEILYGETEKSNIQVRPRTERT